MLISSDVMDGLMDGWISILCLNDNLLNNFLYVVNFRNINKSNLTGMKMLPLNIMLCNSLMITHIRKMSWLSNF